ncbi:MAG: DNA mismatch repair endonuclease MutL [Candidatus Cyclonatronum sp.]|uniref:DNA mismatch repair endonuclease MutL n=1 Tax=Cyclonatronum sp. TaxID=3024185 RepID=UPI0025BF3694|nr:DNA mismatch repair endonuclease MutL [Cyclonatronum sp.]MCH8485667.1 DNA mismatch repair endonuclease MutL [Cyclonatronum sp.]
MTTPSDSVIHLLPSELANKIAAGEVVERPASVVKELLDNAIDSGADSIKVLIQQSGRSMIQVTDNGCGMSKEDLVMCFRRHATSKISSAEDLYNIHTLGFRGEAMASVASVAQVNIKTRRIQDESGWEHEVRGGQEKEPVPAATQAGTSVTVRNLFFNVPARRAFLKTDATELRHIIIAVQQAALAHPEIAFEFSDEKEIIYRLPSGSLADRIAGIYGKSYRASLLPVEESTSLFTLRGYLIDPKMAKKNRGEQFLFVNGRPFMHRHLNYIIQNVYSSWIGKEMYPFYALYYELEPGKIDVNVHPSKLEIKFEDERSVAAFTRSIITRSLNERFNVPDASFDETGERPPRQPFTFPEGFGGGSGSSLPGNRGGSWPDRFGTDSDRRTFGNKGFNGNEMMEKLYPSGISEQLGGTAGFGQAEGEQAASRSAQPAEKVYDKHRGYWQLHDQYIISQTRSGMFIIDQYAAHTRIIFERATNSAEAGLPGTQQLLFPQIIDFSASDFALLKDVLPTLRKIGFNIQLMSGNSAQVLGVPAELTKIDEKPIIESILQDFQNMGNTSGLDPKEKLLFAYATKAAIPRGRKLNFPEMEALIDQLFACSNPFFDPVNRPTTVFIPLDDIHKRFR